MRPLNGTKPDAQELIDRILADERFRASSHFSDRVYTDEPILITGNRMASYLPERYRKMAGDLPLGARGASRSGTLALRGRTVLPTGHLYGGL